MTDIVSNIIQVRSGREKEYTLLYKCDCCDTYSSVRAFNQWGLDKCGVFMHWQCPTTEISANEQA
jgi:hypothetical protein